MDKEWLLSLTKAGIERNGHWLVHDIDLDIYRGEIVTLIGPNGSGKSTTAKMALGILKPSAGTVTRKAGLRIGYVPQRLVIDPSLPLTVRRFMTLTARLDANGLKSVLSETGVDDLINANVADLSGGELQRVLLARSIARKPDLLVLDEPLQGVDYNGETELYGLIASLRTKLDCGILLISHDLHIVMAAAYGRLIGAIPENGLALYEHHHNHRHNIHGAVISTSDNKPTRNIGANDNG